MAGDAVEYHYNNEVGRSPQCVRLGYESVFPYDGSRTTKRRSSLPNRSGGRIFAFGRATIAAAQPGVGYRGGGEMAEVSDANDSGPTTLGVSIESSGITAVLADSAGLLIPLQLGSTDLPTASAVAQSPDGAVLVGDAALRSSGPIATDPMGRARAGRVGALTAVLAHVVGRAAAMAGSTPNRLAIVVPDDWTREERDRLVESGAAAGITDVVLVPAAAAGSGRTGAPPAVAMAAAAAVAAATGNDQPPPIVTREQLGGGITPAGGRPASRPTESPSSPKSVFEGESAPTPRPATPSSATSATPPTGTPLPGPAPRAAGVDPTMAMPAAAVPRSGPPPQGPSKHRLPVALLVAVAILVVVGAAVGAFALAGGDDASVAPVTTTIPTTTVATTTAPPATSTSTTSTSTTSTTSTTTTTSTTSTTSTTTTSTTTIPVPVGQPGPVTLVETGVQLDNGTVLTLGQDAAAATDSISAVLGAPNADSGWIETEFCAGPRARVIRWGDFEIVLTEGVLDSEVGEFTQWYIDGIDNPGGLVTVDGLGYGATVGFLEVTYGAAFELFVAIEGDPSGLFVVTNPGSGGVLLGITDLRDPDGAVVAMWAGDSCTRIFT